MALYEISPARAAGAQLGAKLARPVELICFALIVVNAVYLAASYVQGSLADRAERQRNGIRFRQRLGRRPARVLPVMPPRPTTGRRTS